MEMPKPTDGHRKLEKMAGEWSGKETMYPSPWDPKGGVASARLKSQMALGGFALVSDYEQERDGTVTYQGHAVYTYDPNEQTYSLHWFDSMGSPAEAFRGKFEGGVLTLLSRNARGHARMSYDLSGKDALKSKMEVSEDGENWTTFFDGEYRRG
jgi:Protein of unknown function (DUF1579)